MRRDRGWRLLVYLWAGPNTLLGLLFVVLALVSGGRVRRVRGVLECHGGLLIPLLRTCTPLAGGAAAVALGHVVLARSPAALDDSREHERAHVRQAERWGVLFLPAYAIASLVAWVRGGCPYEDNVFELEAAASEDGASRQV